MFINNVYLKRYFKRVKINFLHLVLRNIKNNSPYTFCRYTATSEVLKCVIFKMYTNSKIKKTQDPALKHVNSNAT